MLTANFLLLAVLAGAHNFSMLDFWQRKCDAGDEKACERLQESEQDVVKLSKLDQRAEAYGKRISKGEMLGENGKPRLDIAYQEVMQEFIVAENDSGNDEIVYDKTAVEYCANHFYQYWTNKKLWWPTDINGDPDWTGIYFYIVDHYYGICLRRYY
ncbi:MAG: hypothetical protein ACR2P9_09585 [Gammaproteobacteria bacterium]